MDERDAQQIDMALRAYVKSLCAPIWWESGGQIVVNSGTMCVIKTPEAVFGVTNHHVLKIYERHKAERQDIFCQLGSGPFDPSANLIDRSEYWDLATFKIPDLTLRTFGHQGVLARDWPPKPIAKDDHIVFGGYPEIRRSVPPGPNPPTVSIDFVSFRRQPHNCSPEQVSFHVDPAQVAWLPNVHEPLQPGASLSGMSGGPCFRLLPAEDRIELAGFIYEGNYSMGIIFVREARLISATGRIEPRPF
jgi:hypothetical protein